MSAAAARARLEVAAREYVDALSGDGRGRSNASGAGLAEAKALQAALGSSTAPGQDITPGRQAAGHTADE